MALFHPPLPTLAFHERYVMLFLTASLFKTVNIYTNAQRGLITRLFVRLSINLGLIFHVNRKQLDYDEMVISMAISANA